MSVEQVDSKSILWGLFLAGERLKLFRAYHLFSNVFDLGHDGLLIKPVVALLLTISCKWHLDRSIWENHNLVEKTTDSMKVFQSSVTYCSTHLYIQSIRSHSMIHKSNNRQPNWSLVWKPMDPLLLKERIYGKRKMINSITNKLVGHIYQEKLVNAGCWCPNEPCNSSKIPKDGMVAFRV